MTNEFNWWNRTPEEGKYKVKAKIYGNVLTFTRHQGHHTRWEPHTPTDDDFDRLLSDANKRVPRRLISPKQMKEIETVAAAKRNKR
ncbi:MAG: hypothetical protein J6386_22100 [Candidatus Synoicihabitans palmerolidicus]|nr:hypothetical protein [Candidatus Synoicihabitans palmerolidicus]